MAYILSQKRALEVQRFTVLVEFSAVLAGISASTAEISGMPMLFAHCAGVFFFEEAVVLSAVFLCLKSASEVRRCICAHKKKRKILLKKENLYFCRAYKAPERHCSWADALILSPE